MKSFTDRTGRTWTVEITVHTVRQVLAQTGVDLRLIDDSQTMQRLSTDPLLLVDVLYVVCREQAERDAVSDEAFGRAIVGDTLDDATAALIEEWIDFFPPSRRGLMRRAVTVYNERLQAGIAAATEQLDSPAERARFQSDLERMLSRSSSSAPPESSASTPDR